MTPFEQKAKAEKENFEKVLADTRDEIRMLEQLQQSNVWEYLKKTFEAAAEGKRVEAMAAKEPHTMARDMGYMSALRDMVNLPEIRTRMLKMQLANLTNTANR